MILTLEIIGSQAEKLGVLRRKTFNATGGTIGRLPDNHWTLPDQYVSNRHALIRYAGGVFLIEDTSTNGIFINSPDNRLVKGQPYALKSGDWIFIEPYEIKASIVEAHGEARVVDDPFAPSAPIQEEDRMVPDDPFAPWQSAAKQVDPVLSTDHEPLAGEVDPLIALGLGSKRSSKPVPRAPDLAAKSSERDHFTPPRPVPSDLDEDHDEPAPPIPDDYDPLQPSDSRVSLPSRPRSDSPRAESAPPRPAPVKPVVRPVAAPSAESKRSVPERRDVSPTIDLRAVLAGAGLENVAVNPELARDFGEILRVVVGGVMDVLQARQKLKSEFRMGMTTFKPLDNNPLKFSANVDDALHNLLLKRNAAYLSPVDAFEDAFDDLRNHQIAMLAGLRVAFDTMLAEFSPDRLQEEFDRQLKKSALLPTPAKLRYWDLYREKFHDMVRDSERCFRELFGEAFADAYEEQLNLLRAHGHAPKR
jgi:type VI secretion system FHA domain protein